MTLGLAEALIDEVVAYFQTAMTPKLASIEGEYVDGVELPAVKQYLVGERELGTLQDWPAILLKCEGGQEVAFQEGFLTSTLTLNITVLVLEADPEALERKVYRYVRAVLECLMEGMPANAITWQPTREGLSWDYSPVFTNKQGQLLMDAVVRWRLKKQEVI